MMDSVIQLALAIPGSDCKVAAIRANLNYALIMLYSDFENLLLVGTYVWHFIKLESS